MSHFGGSLAAHNPDPDMKYAQVDGRRQEARPNLTGECPGCGRAVIARCGEVRIPHWAHKGRVICDPWWENETAWHRAWKDQFPAHWQEVVHVAGDGERHIADVKTSSGWVIEFQHSFIRPEERRSRNAFYRKLIWVVDGTRRTRDKAQLITAWNQGAHVGRNARLRKAAVDSCALLREWATHGGPVFFDFGDADALWWLVGRGNSGWAYLQMFSRTQFVNCLRGPASESARAFEAFLQDVPQLITSYEAERQPPPFAWGAAQPGSYRRRFRL